MGETDRADGFDVIGVTTERDPMVGPLTTEALSPFVRVIPLMDIDVGNGGAISVTFRRFPSLVTIVPGTTTDRTATPLRQQGILPPAMEMGRLESRMVVHPTSLTTVAIPARIVVTVDPFVSWRSQAYESGVSAAVATAVADTVI